MSKCSCGKPKKDWHLACLDCWALVPSQLQARVFRLYKHERGSDAHREAVRECFEIIHQQRNTPKAGRTRS